MNEGEIWKDVVGFEGYYQVSTHGRVRSIDRVVNRIRKNKPPIPTLYRGVVLKPGLKDTGYRIVILSVNDKNHTRKIARLVAIAFIPNPQNKKLVNHKDGVKTNDIVDNLEWNTYSENLQHAYDIGLHKPRK